MQYSLHHTKQKSAIFFKRIGLCNAEGMEDNRHNFNKLNIENIGLLQKCLEFFRFFSTEENLRKFFSDMY